MGNKQNMHLAEKLAAGLAASEDGEPNLLPVRERYLDAFEKLPDAAEEIVTAYHRVATEHDLAPGNIRLFLVGGRVKGVGSKPLSADSDLDLVFAVDNISEGLHALPRQASSRGEAEWLRDAWQRELTNEISTIWEGHGIAISFDVHEFGWDWKDEEQFSAESPAILLAEFS